MDPQTLSLLESSVRSLLSNPPDDIVQALEDLGWADVVAEDEVASYLTLFTVHGELGASTALLDFVAASAAGLDPRARIVWPWLGLGEDVLGVVISGPPREAPLVLPSGNGVVEVDRHELRRLGGLDPTAPWFTVTGSISETPLSCDWSSGIAAARRSLAADLVGVARHALSIAGDHVASREQFGRPIGSFQAVRHLLASGYASLAGAEALLTAAWVDGGSVAASTAKASAAFAFSEVSGAALQVCGGMGLSSEHALPAAIRRGMILSSLLGGQFELHRSLGFELLDGKEPTLVGEF